MRWTPGNESSNIEDRRGDSGGGGIGGIHLGIGGTIIVLVLSLIFHRNLFTLLGSGDAASSSSASDTSAPPASESPAEHKEVQFVSFVLDDAQQTWAKILPQEGASYHDAKLVLFRDGVQSGCGQAETAMGPFYCPLDEKVYIDLGFYDELRDRFGAPGEFAQAYVLAHELGHHVQHLEGIDTQMQRLQRQHPDQTNQLSVKLELQADCYAGVWGHSTQQRQLLDPGDVQAGLQAAASVGDDRLQKMSTGRVSPESFTHGTSAQREAWFKRGFDSGDPKACDTFSPNAA
ncbi:MAG TPA: neutral zinc metallopeptidase [Gemmatimonadaceae bacterium]|jgi:predicted metalloprotease|nr:neutral zinc metallopeptidase [Gemmatimonadaceae bacterium]